MDCIKTEHTGGFQTCMPSLCVWRWRVEQSNVNQRHYFVNEERSARGLKLVCISLHYQWAFLNRIEQIFCSSCGCVTADIKHLRPGETCGSLWGVRCRASRGSGREREQRSCPVQDSNYLWGPSLLGIKISAVVLLQLIFSLICFWKSQTYAQVYLINLSFPLSEIWFWNSITFPYFL